MGESSKIRDQPTTAKQLAVAQWFANYKGIPMPPEIITSYFKWWGWLNANVTDIDREDAHAARVDFGLRAFDEDNPVRVIGTLKYASVADEACLHDVANLAALSGAGHVDTEMQLSVDADDLKELIQQRKHLSALSLILANAHPDDVQGDLGLTEGEMTNIVRYIYDAYREFEINWGIA